MSRKSWFLSSEIPRGTAENALFHLIPAPLEVSVSYGGGTRKGPTAILAASDQLELTDGNDNPSEAGIFTYPPIKARNTELFLEKLKARCLATALSGKIPVVLGGEHTVSQAPILALHEARKNPFGVIQIDAHADLRDTYEGSVFSHACVMRRVVENGIPLYQLSNRAFCREEEEARREFNIQGCDGRELALGEKTVELPAGFPRDIYITVDVDGFDPAVFPSTGTPVPGGLQWFQGLFLLEKLTRGRNIIGFDLVELAPQKNIVFPDFNAALLIYKIMAMALRNRIS